MAKLDNYDTGSIRTFLNKIALTFDNAKMLSQHHKHTYFVHQVSPPVFASQWLKVPAIQLSSKDGIQY